MGRREQRLDWQTVDLLVTELHKDYPDEQLVESLMTKVGLIYDQDPIIRMGTVLEALNKERSRRGRRENESSI